MLKPKKNSIRNSGAAAQTRYQEKLKLIFEHLLRWQMIDLYSCQLLLDLKKSSASQTLNALKKRDILQEIPAPNCPAKPYILTKKGLEEAQKNINIYEYPDATVHPSRIKSKQISHDLLTIATTLELLQTPDSHEFFFGGDTFYPKKIIEKNKISVLSDRELRSILSAWRAGDQREAAPVDVRGKIADAVITLHDKRKNRLGTCFVEVQESYEKSSKVVENFEHYLKLIASGEGGEYSNKRSATCVIFASTNSAILSYFEEKLHSITDEFYDRTQSVIEPEKYIFFHDISHLKKRYSY